MKYFALFSFIVAVFLVSCTERKKVKIIQPVCIHKKDYEVVKDNISDYPVSYKKKKRKCLIQYKTKYIYVDEK